jgi:hypothetical protein
MSLFFARKDRRVESFVLKLVNNSCPSLATRLEGPRIDNRVAMVVVAMVVPIQGRKLLLADAFHTVTKEFSNKGVSLVLDQARPLDEVILGFQMVGEMTFIRAQSKHCNPMGAGFYQMGFQLLEVVSPGDYPGLGSLRI